jgi:hypothetical protein
MHGLENMESVFSVFECKNDIAILNTLFPTNNPSPNGDFYETYKHAAYSRN